MIDDKVIGVLSVNGKNLTAPDMPAISAFANHASSALQNARLITDALQRSNELKDLTSRLFNAQEEERRRISLEMHDELGQSLTALGFDLYNIEKALSPECGAYILDCVNSARASISELDGKVSDLALDLRPQMLDDLGLLPTLRWYTDRYTRRTEIEVALEAIDFEERITPEVTIAIYRIVQEALTNAAKHSGASRVTVRLVRQPGAVTVTVHDNGRGFNREGHPNLKVLDKGAGLVGIRERVSLLGGTFDIRSNQGEGTRLTIKIPVKDEV
ncbi:MAG: sensor histidine kinase [Anaerolineales bacterium]|nr:MAG: sensor histidine kinase [Anaerolineales bacterium]